MKKIILAILTMFLITGFLVVDSQADCYRRHGAYWIRPAVVVSSRPYRYYYYPPRPAVYYSPPPVVIQQPAPMVYTRGPWLPGISVFFPGVNIRIR
jgi:hypothetical protein